MCSPEHVDVQVFSLLALLRTAASAVYAKKRPYGEVPVKALAQRTSNTVQRSVAGPGFCSSDDGGSVARQSTGGCSAADVDAISGDPDSSGEAEIGSLAQRAAAMDDACATDGKAEVPTEPEGHDSVAYGLCLLQLRITDRGFLGCALPTLMPSAGLLMPMLPPMLPRGVMIAEATVDRAAALRSTAAVTLSVAPVEGEIRGGRGVIAVLRGTGASFGPALPLWPEEPLAQGGAARGALTGSQFRAAMAGAGGVSACAHMHAWLRGGTPGGDAPSSHAGRVRGPLVRANPVHACVPLAPPVDLSEGATPPAAHPYSGAVVVVDRGGCLFAEKVRNAEAAGAAAVVVLNNAGPGQSAAAAGGPGSGDHPSNHSPPGGGDELDVFVMDGPRASESGAAGEPGIPAAMLSRADGRALTAANACVNDEHVCTPCSLAEGSVEQVCRKCVRRELTAELVSSANWPASVGGGDTGYKGNAVDVKYDVSWKVIKHEDLTEDIKQLEVRRIACSRGRFLCPFEPHHLSIIMHAVQR